VPACRIAVATVGCRANQADSAALIRGLELAAIEIVDDFADADLIVINTCCVTAEAERDCRRLARRALTAAPGGRVVLTGCAVTALPGFAARIDPRLEQRGGGASDPRELADWIRGLAGPAAREAGAPPAARRRTRALLKIQNGCDHHCTYCIVPRARGGPRSLPAPAVLAEAERLAADGWPEVVVSGVQLGAWGVDLPGRPALADLLERIADRLGGRSRLRLSSIEPWSLDDGLLDVIGGHPRICPHLHVPLQSGDDGVLRAMNRGYAAENWLERIAAARSRIDGLGLGTDVLCGFPGEDEAAFDRTLATIAAARVSYLHAFPFSARPGTSAAGMDGRPAVRVARERVRRVRALGEEAQGRFRASLEGTVREVVVEKRRGAGHAGLTDNFVPVDLPGGRVSPGDCVRARLERGREPGRMTAVPEPRERMS
jgi:threonylcarbamoyladenosine tRNA methylthiotransferase MtaB